MPGRNSGDNKFGLTPYIVGTVLGDGCNYSTIQSAIDDAFAAGGGVVGIRKGTYTENLTLRDGVELYGFDVDGRLPSLLSHVSIVGNHTFSVAGGFGAQLSQYINFSAPAGDCFTVNATGGGSAILAHKFCGIEAFAGGGQRAVVLNADGGSSAQYSTDNTNLNSDSHCFESIGAGNHAAFISLGNVNSQTGDVFRHSTGSATLTLEYCSASGALSIFNGVAINGNITTEFASLFSGIESVLFSAGNGQAQIVNTVVSSGAGSGFWIDGTGGQVDFANVVLQGSAIDIGPLITQQKINWQPYGEAAAAAVGSNRGTASFDSAQFTVTDGWVQLSGAGGTVWNEINVNTNAVGNNGYFATANLTLTLPNAPVLGETVKVKNGPGLVTIACTGAQTIQMGTQVSAAAGSAISTLSGDAMELTYQTSQDRWIANNSMGNWNIV